MPGAIGILQIKFAPEPASWLMLVAGAGLLLTLAKLRGAGLGR
ncbi:MAG: PEP-CTERM sorting domain-containing protein [Deltaproteobacteria bacterium]|nr:PEP-CTERM sorting domain-containing protein [Deltaproteobacteria bacterium]